MHHGNCDIKINENDSNTFENKYENVRDNSLQKKDVKRMHYAKTKLIGKIKIIKIIN